ncbi:hypothetical protein Syun_030145 [Stephania yunnanensis]|uniref:(S)-ureidoglycine aminohydrolase cupin domain-containing protein n=1 Tax=Stephania yunnanensis TaxID=152371 RepID=A0AAP0HKJ1_9MAGN
MEFKPSEGNFGIKVERNPSTSRLAELGIKSWPKWGCPPGKFPVKYEAEETCYLLKGKVKVCGTNKGCSSSSSPSECVEFGAGDLVILPKGLSCTWEVSVAIDKYYKFDSSSSSSS